MVLAAACGAPGWFARGALASEPAPVLPERIGLSVPFVRQKGDWCGPAALAMVLGFHGRRLAQDEIAAQMHAAKGGGALNLDLKLYARSLGFQAESKSGSLDDVRRELAAGRPVICTIREQPWPGRRGLHYVPVVGYDDPKKELVAHLRRPFARIGFDSFESRWKPAGHWMLTITAPATGSEGQQGEAKEQPP